MENKRQGKSVSALHKKKVIIKHELSCLNRMNRRVRGCFRVVVLQNHLKLSLYKESEQNRGIQASPPFVNTLRLLLY